MGRASRPGVARSAVDATAPGTDKAESLRIALANVWRWLGVVALAGATVFLAYKVVQFDSEGWRALDFKFDAAQRLVDGQTLYPADASGEYAYPPLWAFLVSLSCCCPTPSLRTSLVSCAPRPSSGRSGSSGCVTRSAMQLRLCQARSCPVPRSNASAVVALLLALGYRFNGAPLGVAVAVKLAPGR